MGLGAVEALSAPRGLGEEKKEGVEAGEEVGVPPRRREAVALGEPLEAMLPLPPPPPLPALRAEGVEWREALA